MGESGKEWERHIHTSKQTVIFLSVCKVFEVSVCVRVCMREANGPPSSIHFNSIRFDSIHVENATQNRWKFKCYVHIWYAAAVVSRWELKRRRRNNSDIRNNSSSNNRGDKKPRTLWRVRKQKKKRNEKQQKLLMRKYAEHKITKLRKIVKFWLSALLVKVE